MQNLKKDNIYMEWTRWIDLTVGGIMSQHFIEEMREDMGLESR